MRAPLPTERGVQYTGVMIEQALTDFSVDYTSSTKEAVVHCVFHRDDADGKPNLYINLDQKCGTYHCFRCGARGKFSEYVQRISGFTLVKTLQYLINLKKRVRGAGTNVDEGYTPSKQLREEQPEDTLSQYDVFHPYPASRGLSAETVKRWCVGYDKDRDAITLPWFDGYGRFITIKRRNVENKRYMYPAGADLKHTLYGLHHVRQHGMVWIVEGEFDAMLLDQVFRLAHLDRHFACALGGSALLPTQVQALLKKQPDCIVYFTDNDDAGREALAQARKIVGSSVRSLVAEYPSDCEVKDPGELTFTQILNTAVWAETEIAK